MTAQVSETLIYHGKELMMFSNPLDPYLRAAGITKHHQFFTVVNQGLRYLSCHRSPKVVSEELI